MLALALTLVMAMGPALSAYAEETLEDKLVKAFQEEQAVLARYEAVPDAFGDVRLLVNIARAGAGNLPGGYSPRPSAGKAVRAAGGAGNERMLLLPSA